MQGEGSHCVENLQGVVTPTALCPTATTAVKMQSKGQGTIWGSVKRSSDVLVPISSTASGQEVSLIPTPQKEEEKGPGTYCTCMHQRFLTLLSLVPRQHK